MIDEVSRYAGLAIGTLAVAVLVATVAPGGRPARQSAVLLVVAFVAFVVIDLATGHGITNASPQLGGLALLILAGVILVDLVVLTRRLRRSERR